MEIGSDSAARGLSPHQEIKSGTNVALNLVFVCVSFSAVTLVVSLNARSPGSLEEAAPGLFAWGLAVVVADLLAVSVWGSVTLSLSFLILLAAGMVLPVEVVGALALTASADRREFRREVSFLRALFNRSQVALATMAAAAVFHGLEGDVYDWPVVLAVTLAALTVDAIVNLALVLVPVRITTGLGYSSIMRRVLIERPAERGLAYLGVGLLAPVLALLYLQVGPWGLVGILGPVVIAYQVFLSQHQLRDASADLTVKKQALASTVASVAEERRQERLFVAGDLHDEVLQPLYQVHLMGQVLRRDLESGRLLDLDQDLPSLLQATEEAQRAIRRTVRELRSSTLGVGGLVGTLELLVEQFQDRTGMEVELDSVVAEGSALSELVLFQVARESLANIEKHSGATKVQILLTRDSQDFRLSVADNGRGFEPLLVDHYQHFGLQLLRERVEALGGLFSVESHQDQGTVVTARVPIVHSWDGSDPAS